jgi:hypothetical protein
VPEEPPSSDLPEVFDDLDWHMAEAGSLAKAAVPPGMYLAWCANLQLISGRFTQDNEDALLRLRYRELSPAEFFTATTSGALTVDLLSPSGADFSRAYYHRYMDDYRATFDDEPYAVKDDWAHYDQIAAELTRHYMGWKDGGRAKKLYPRSNGERLGSRSKWWRKWLK